MCQKHGNIPFFHLEGDEQKHETDGCHDLRIHHRKVVYLFHDIAYYLSGTGQSDCRHRTYDSCHNRRKNSDTKGGIERGHHVLGLQHVLIPAKGKSGKAGQRFSVIEGKDDHIEDRQIEKSDHQNHQSLP